MERELIKCLFCAVDIPRVKSEVFITPDTDDHELSNFGSEAKDWFGGENPSIEKNLKGFFILKKILKISEDSLTKFLIRNEGKFDTRLWANVCVSCGDCVRRFHHTLVQISKLERQLKELEEELKTRIESSHDERGEQEDSSDWSWIRSEVLGYHSPGSFDVEPCFQMPVILGTNSTSTSTVPIHFNPKVGQDSGDFSISHADEELFPDLKIGLEPADNEQEHPTSLFLDEDEDDHNYVPPSLEPPRQSIRQHLRLSHNVCLPVAKNQGDLSPNLKQFYTMGGNGTSSSFHYKCLQCPYKSTGLARIRVHVAVHYGGSGETCPDCGILVDPKRMVHHQSQRHGRSKKKGRKVRQRLSHNVRRPVAKNQGDLPPNPNLKQFYTVGGNRTSSSFHYKCLQCPYKSTGLARIRVHIAVHNGGSGETCPDCGILVDPKKMLRHQSRQHGRSKKKGGKSRQTLPTPSSSNDCKLFLFESSSP